jgi:hypothetical protein
MQSTMRVKKQKVQPLPKILLEKLQKKLEEMENLERYNELRASVDNWYKKGSPLKFDRAAMLNKLSRK